MALRVPSVLLVALAAVLVDASTTPLLRAVDVPVGQIVATVDLAKINLAKPDGLVPAYGRLSLDGACLAAITADTGALWLVDAVNGKQLRFFRSEDFTPKVRFSAVGLGPDGKQVTADGGGNILVLDAESGKEILTIKAPGQTSRFSPDGKMLAVYSSHYGDVYNATTGEKGGVIFDRKDYGKNNQLIHIAFSPDGKRLLVCEKFRIKVKEADTGKDLLTIPTGDRTPTEGLFSPDSKQFIAWVGPECRVWDADGKEVRSFPALGGRIAPHVFSPDGTLLAGGDGYSQKVWSVETGKEILKVALDPDAEKWAATSLAFSDDGKRLAVWYPDAGKVVWWQVAK